MSFTIRHTFSKNERLRSKKLIAQLFEQGETLDIYPLRMFYLPCRPTQIPNHQVLFAVSKKKFKSAVVRNRIKRKLREAYRCNKHLLYKETLNNAYFLIAYSYLGSNEKPNFVSIQEKMITSMHHLEGLAIKTNL
ncbi:MAG: ribonuclease P protein component [Cytophagales bacterium]|nr:ribonuclease P protein component [Cytophagales bacterium]